MRSRNVPEMVWVRASIAWHTAERDRDDDATVRRRTQVVVESKETQLDVRALERCGWVPAHSMKRSTEHSIDTEIALLLVCVGGSGWGMRQRASASLPQHHRADGPIPLRGHASMSTE